MNSPVPPRRLGRYELGPLLGHGGQGAVYRATLVGPGGFRKEVALKILTSSGSSLQREARIGGLLRHPNLVDVFEVGQADGTNFAAMELCEGGSLTDHIPLPPRAVVDVGLAVCGALRYAHEELGLVHRDIKPSNLLLSRSGDIKVADLGIALAQGFGDDRRIRGTPLYMAPEQARGEPLDPRADVFALGVTLIELATGSPHRDSETLHLDLFGDAPGSRERSLDVPDWLAPAVDRCLRPDPRDRWPDIDALERALRALDATGATLAACVGTEQVAAPRRQTHNLPAPSRPFIEREAEVAAVLTGLRRPGVVAVVGSGGIGKSQLALEATRRWLDETRGQAWLCDLSGVQDVDGILGVVAGAMGVPLTSVQALDQLGWMFAGRGPTVVLLDSVEHLRAHAAVVSRWLDAAPELRVLLTSRVAMGLTADHTVQVPPMTRLQSVDLLIALAEQRGVELLPGPELDALADRLDGIPLALELAAGRLGVLTIEDVASRLGQGILRSSKSGRHQTLRATLEWSWSGLEPSHQQGLTQLTAFAGDFSAEAAEYVLDLPRGSSTLDLLDTLVRHSVLRPSGTRFRVLRGMRELAEGRAERGPALRRHATWFARMGSEDFLTHLDLPGGESRRQALVTERENLLAGLSYAITSDEPELAIQLLDGTWAVLRDQGPLEMGLSLAAEVLGMVGLTPEIRSRAQSIAGGAAVMVGQMPQARTHLDQALQAFRKRGDTLGEADALARMGELLWRQGALRDAQAMYEQALTAATAAGSKRREARVTGLLGVVCHHLGQLDEALRHEQAAVRMFHDLGAARGEAVALGNLATLYHTLARHEDAREAYEATLQRVRDQGNRRVEGVTLSNLGNLLLHAGQPEGATALYTQALAIHRELGNPRAEGRTLGCLGLAASDVADRERYLDAAVRIASSTGDERQQGYWLLQLARRVGGTRTREWLEHAERILQSVGDPSMLAILHATYAEFLWTAGSPIQARLRLRKAEELAPAGDQESNDALDEARRTVV